MPGLIIEGGAWLNQMKNCMLSAHLYQLDPKMMAMPATIEPIRKFRMDPDGFGLATLLDDLLGYAPERFIELRQRFCEYFPQFRNVRLEAESAVQRHYDDRGGFSNVNAAAGKGIFFETRSGKSIRAQQASDGAILFLGFLALTSLPVPPKLILIEEPEKGVYPKRLEEIVKLLRNVVTETPASSRPQIILSTHSPYLVSFFEPEEVTLMSRNANNGVVAHPMRDIPHIKERLGGGEFYLGELWYNLSEEELFGGAPLQTA
jgi:predicted ATPase